MKYKIQSRSLQQFKSIIYQFNFFSNLKQSEFFKIQLSTRLLYFYIFSSEIYFIPLLQRRLYTTLLISIFYYSQSDEFQIFSQLSLQLLQLFSCDYSCLGYIVVFSRLLVQFCHVSEITCLGIIGFSLMEATIDYAYLVQVTSDQML